MSQTEQELSKDRPTISVASHPGLERQQGRSSGSGSHPHVIPSELHIFIPLTVIFILLLMTGVAALGATSVFVPLFVGVVITYVAGSLYLFKKLMTY